MKLNKKLMASLLVLTLLLCLLPASALAAPLGLKGLGNRPLPSPAVPEAEVAEETEVAEEAEEVLAEAPEVTDAEAEAVAEEAELLPEPEGVEDLPTEAPEAVAEDAAEPDPEELEAALDAILAQAEEEEEPEVALAPEDVAELESEQEHGAPPQPETYCNEAGETYYAKNGELIYNNEGVVYNNGGTVYNNGGTVYNNTGLVYNNSGTVYSNGGIVYNNGGKVYSNGAVVYAFEGDVETSLIAGYYRVSVAKECEDFAEIQGLEVEPGTEDALMMAKDAVVTITPREGFSLFSVEAEGATLTEEEDGSFTLTDPTDAFELAIRFQADPPVFSLPEGTYNGPQALAMEAVDGAQIYYTLDGSAIDEDNCILYEGPIDLEEGAVVTAVAVVDGTEISAPATASYAIVSVSAPVFEPVEEGYATPAAQGVGIENSGAVAARVEGVSLSGDDADCFTLNRTGSGRISAGATNNNTWVVRPAGKLAPGSYQALLTLNFDSGDSAVLELSFQVNAEEAAVEEAMADAATEEVAAAATEEAVEEAEAEVTEAAEEAEAEAEAAPKVA